MIRPVMARMTELLAINGTLVVLIGAIDLLSTVLIGAIVCLELKNFIYLNQSQFPSKIKGAQLRGC